jgi:hypothetical protein
MFKDVYNKLNAEISAQIPFNYVAEISRHHRIQASPGLRDAVTYAVETLKENGVNAEVKSYPANDKDYAWTSLMFKEWSCKNAELELVEPEDKAKFLARWHESKLSLIQKSQPTFPEGVTAEVVLLEDGETQKEYKKLDVKNKIVLSKGDLNRVYELAIKQRGAIGIITDRQWVREPDLPEGELEDALKYTSFWWNPGDVPCFGFVLTPRNGKWLRKLIKESKKPVKVHAKVESTLSEGLLDNAVATIPGETNEEVIVVAHICHPQPSCNDNASGSAATMEAARAIQKLISEKQLSKPKRTIRFTLVPEMSGTYAYLADREKDILQMVAAINMDMVGEKQDVCGGPFIVERTPESTPSYVNALIQAIFDEIKGEVKNLGGSSRYALFKHHVSPFSGGSDHYVYSDPSVGVPCPMLIQWPDKFWHTSYDTIDKVDPEMLRKAALIAATYAYTIANAEAAQAIWLATETFTRELNSITTKFQDNITMALTTEPKEAANILKNLKKLDSYHTNKANKAIQSVKRLSNDKEVEKTVETLLKDLNKTVKSLRQRAEENIKAAINKKGASLPKTSKRLNTLEKKTSSIIPKRLYRGPINVRSWLSKLTKEEQEAYYQLGKKHSEARILGTLAIYWTDGKRNLYEISQQVMLETGRTNLEYLADYFEFLNKMKLIEYLHINE